MLRIVRIYCDCLNVSELKNQTDSKSQQQCLYIFTTPQLHPIHTAYKGIELTTLIYASIAC